jgi:hypothetical protein
MDKDNDHGQTRQMGQASDQQETRQPQEGQAKAEARRPILSIRLKFER